ncbi:MAG: GNAT family N-acetyltransferase [Burkholderiaceae bacterium]
MPAIALRPATAADIPLLGELGARTFRETYASISDPAEVDEYAATHFTAAKVAGWLATPASVTLLATLDGAPAGYAHVRRGTPAACVPDRGAAELSRLYLLASAQGRGAGAALMRRALAEAAALGARTLWLGVYDRNVKAVRFYEAWGFAQVGTHAFEFGGRVYADPVMARAIGDAPPGGQGGAA